MDIVPTSSFFIRSLVDVLMRKLEGTRNGKRRGLRLSRCLGVIGLRASDGSHHTVISSSLTAADADEAIAGEIEHHRRLGVGFEWKWYAHDTPADLVDRLACHGLDVHDNDFVIGLIGRELHPLSHLVQTMRKTVQTSQYLQTLGPFFVGHVRWQSAGAR